MTRNYSQDAKSWSQFIGAHDLAVVMHRMVKKRYMHDVSYCIQASSGLVFLTNNTLLKNDFLWRAKVIYRAGHCNCPELKVMTDLRTEVVLCLPQLIKLKNQNPWKSLRAHPQTNHASSSSAAFSTAPPLCRCRIYTKGGTASRRWHVQELLPRARASTRTINLAR